MYKTIAISPLDLHLDESNPRFLTNKNIKKNQESILKYLINFENILPLAEAINDFGGLIPGERILVIEENNKYTVLEGNRRTTALKILLDPNILSSVQNDLKFKSYPIINEKCKTNITKIEVDLVNDREIANYSLYRRHIDGIKKWSQISKMYFYKNLLEQDHNIEYLVEVTSETKSEIIKVLNGYSIIRIMIDNYHQFFPTSTYIEEAGEAFLDTELLGTRLLPLYKRLLGISFNTYNYEMIAFKDTHLQNKLIHILVSIAHLYWETKGINTRILNKKAETDKFFTQPIILKENQKNYDSKIQEQNKLVALIQDYIKLKDFISTKSDLITIMEKPEPKSNNTPSIDVNLSNNSVSSKSENVSGDFGALNSSIDSDKSDSVDTSTNINSHSSLGSSSDTSPPINLPSSIESNNSDVLEGPTSSSSPVATVISTEENAPGVSGTSTATNLDSQLKGRPRKNPSEYNHLLKAYPFKNAYRNNSRINETIKELEKLDYKVFRLSTNFLIRSLLESYAYEYTKLFSNLHHTHENKLRGLTIKNFSSTELNDKFSNYIAQHIGKIDNGYYATTEARIISLFNKSNNFSITQQLNQFVHLPDFNPTALEILQSWENLSGIIQSLDEVIYKYSTQN